MFDIMIKILPNNRLIVRDTRFDTSVNIRANQLSEYIESILDVQFDAQKEWDDKVEDLSKNDVNRFNINSGED